MRPGPTRGRRPPSRIDGFEWTMPDKAGKGSPVAAGVPKAKSPYGLPFSPLVGLGICAILTIAVASLIYIGKNYVKNKAQANLAKYSYSGNAGKFGLSGASAAGVGLKGYQGGLSDGDEESEGESGLAGSSSFGAKGTGTGLGGALTAAQRRQNAAKASLSAFGKGTSGKSLFGKDSSDLSSSSDAADEASDEDTEDGGTSRSAFGFRSSSSLSGSRGKKASALTAKSDDDDDSSSDSEGSSSLFGAKTGGSWGASTDRRGGAAKKRFGAGGTLGGSRTGSGNAFGSGEEDDGESSLGAEAGAGGLWGRGKSKRSRGGGLEGKGLDGDGVGEGGAADASPLGGEDEGVTEGDDGEGVMGISSRTKKSLFGGGGGLMAGGMRDGKGRGGGFEGKGTRGGGGIGGGLSGMKKRLGGGGGLGDEDGSSDDQNEFSEGLSSSRSSGKGKGSKSRLGSKMGFGADRDATAEDEESSHDDDLGEFDSGLSKAMGTKLGGLGGLQRNGDTDEDDSWQSSSSSRADKKRPGVRSRFGQNLPTDGDESDSAGGEGDEGLGEFSTTTAGKKSLRSKSTTRSRKSYGALDEYEQETESGLRGVAGKGLGGRGRTGGRTAGGLGALEDKSESGEDEGESESGGSSGSTNRVYWGKLGTRARKADSLGMGKQRKGSGKQRYGGAFGTDALGAADGTDGDETTDLGGDDDDSVGGGRKGSQGLTSRRGSPGTSLNKWALGRDRAHGGGDSAGGNAQGTDYKPDWGEGGRKAQGGRGGRAGGALNDGWAKIRDVDPLGSGVVQGNEEEVAWAKAETTRKASSSLAGGSMAGGHMAALGEGNGGATGGEAWRVGLVREGEEGIGEGARKKDPMLDMDHLDIELTGSKDTSRLSRAGAGKASKVGGKTKSRQGRSGKRRKSQGGAKRGS
eukprot:TRINITY_DN38977_c0_g1_i1.p1 TRINITY_DN38977_c0_g1~~TRINITY_DN38977_c0_g1_i1.p1  ORF type:complete len:912 (-),score=201.04 TRINITY_DN38977_c0_g1_i1:677-3412(-)